MNDRQVVDAAKKSNSLEFIEKLSEGFETSIGENGAKVSGGQAQRIAIARCFYKNADLIIFDEPTSALDEISENEIMSTISKLNSTVVIISHNKELLQFCDKIYGSPVNFEVFYFGLCDDIVYGKAYFALLF